MACLLLCAGATGAQVAIGSGTFRGVVRTASSDSPLPGSEVAFPDLGRRTTTDSSGEFRFDSLPVGPQRLSVRRIGFGAIDTTVTIGGSSAAAVFRLTAVVAIDSVVVTETPVQRAMREFEDNRRKGLGRFLVRSDLERMEGQTMASILAQFPGVAIVNGRGAQAWISTTRVRTHCPGNNIRCLRDEEIYYLPDVAESGQGMRAACYAQVYLDNMLVTHGRPTEPFDISSLHQSQIEAIEYYSNPAQTPPRYNKLGATCGVLVIHSRR